MTLVGFIGLLLGLSAALVAYKRWTPVRTLVFALAYGLHVVSAYVAYRLAVSGPADAALYYYDTFGSYEDGFGLNTQFIIYVVQFTKDLIGGTFLDYFLIFQSFGLFGMAILMRVFEEIYDELRLEQPIWAYLLFLIPSLHFWSSGIGKDAPFFLAAALGVWGAMNIRKRFIGFGAAALLMLMIRPHVAILALAALAVTVLTDRNTKLYVRVTLAASAAAGISYAIGSVLGTFNIDLTSADVVSDRLIARENVLNTDESGSASVDAAFPIRLLSLLFRPMFFDAQDLFGLVASFENFLILLMIGAAFWHARQLLAIARAVPYMRYGFMFAGALIILFAFEYYNIGLGLRQKWAMIMPTVLVLYVTLRAVLASKRMTRGAPSAY